MIKNQVWLTLLVLLFVLTACGSTEGNGAAQLQDDSGQNTVPLNSTPSALSNSEGRDIPLVMKLALGSFLLEDTQYPIDKEQAAVLLPLWKASISLSNSETTASEEIEALINQIQSSMTAEQTHAIAEMDISFQSARSIADKYNLELGFGGNFGNIDPSMRATMQSARESGQAPPGGMQGMGGVPGIGGPEGGMNLSPEARQTAIAERGESAGASFGISSTIMEAVVKFLESKL